MGGGERKTDREELGEKGNEVATGNQVTVVKFCEEGHKKPPHRVGWGGIGSENLAKMYPSTMRLVTSVKFLTTGSGKEKKTNPSGKMDKQGKGFEWGITIKGPRGKGQGQTNPPKKKTGSKNKITQPPGGKQRGPVVGNRQF